MVARGGQQGPWWSGSRSIWASRRTALSPHRRRSSGAAPPALLRRPRRSLPMAQALRSSCIARWRTGATRRSGCRRRSSSCSLSPTCNPLRQRMPTGYATIGRWDHPTTHHSHPPRHRRTRRTHPAHPPASLHRTPSLPAATGGLPLPLLCAARGPLPVLLLEARRTLGLTLPSPFLPLATRHPPPAPFPPGGPRAS